MDHYIITGTSRGLGNAMARLLLERGTPVVGIARSENSELLESARHRGGRLMQLAGDIGVLEKVPGMVRDALSWLGVESGDSVTLVNNAGVLEPIAFLKELDSRELEHHMRVNLLAPALLSGAFLRETEGRGLRRRITNITTGAAKKPYPGWSAYCSAKAGLNMLTQVTAEEVEKDEDAPRVIAVAPGVVETEMQRTIWKTDASRFPTKEKFLRLREEGRLADPLEAAAKVIRAIEDSSIASGEIVDIRELYPD
jgi:benzil reductase ((S)-benzoin forming)